MDTLRYVVCAKKLEIIEVQVSRPPAIDLPPAEWLWLNYYEIKHAKIGTFWSKLGQNIDVDRSEVKVIEEQDLESDKSK